MQQLGATTLIDILQPPLETETECYCKCPCNPITTTAAPSTTTTVTTTRSPNLMYEYSETGYYPHPDDVCQRYVCCSRGMLRYQYTCVPGEYFTPGNNRCTSEVAPGCEYPNASVMLFDRINQNSAGGSKTIEIKWGECFNLEDIGMDDRVSSLDFLKNE